MTAEPVGLALAELDLRETYLAVATAFQLLLALLTVAIPERDELRWGIGFVLAAGGVETAHFLGQSILGVGVPQPGIRILDTLLVFTLAMLALGLPGTPGGATGSRLRRIAWGVGAAAIVAVNVGLVTASGVQAALESSASRTLRTASFCLATAVGALHVVPRFLELSPGPLRRQTLLAGGGLLLSPVFVGAGYLPGMAEVPSSLEHAFHVTSAWFAAVLVARALWGLRDPGFDRAAFAGILAAGLGLGLIQRVTSTGVLPQVAAHLLRPLLLACAMLRFDLFRVHERFRTWTMPALTVLGAALAFLLIVFLVTPGGADGTQVPPFGALLAATVLVTGTVAWLARGPDREAAGAHMARLQRYRLGLERQRAGGGGGTVRRLQAQLDVSADEHRALELVLDERPLVSTDALEGAEPGEIVAGRFEVDRELGRGGAGRALVAWDRQTERSVVLKEVLRPWEVGADARRRALEREVEIARAVSSPALASVHGLVRDGVRWYLVREHVPGRTLDDLVAEEGPLAPQRVRAIAADVGEGLAALHAEDLLHLDVKPSNVVLRDDGRAVLVDQGTAQRMPDASGTDRSHRTATIGGSGRRGTLAWMAPEQVLERAVTPRTDVFALGALAYHLATGRTHVATDRPAFEVEDAIVNGSPPRDAPDPIADGIEAALSRAPEDRPGSVEALLDRWGTEVAEDASGAEDEEASAHADDVPG